MPFSDETVPGRIMESILANVRDGNVLNTYDFVDVISGSIGWQVKSTKSSTPVTWKRAKVPDSDKLIQESRKSEAGAQRLGDVILDLCNQHVYDSIEKYSLTTIGYARFIVDVKTTEMTYFERQIASGEDRRVFVPDDYEWIWSEPKRSSKKEQLPALQGIERSTGCKVFAWHGRGENQLHFTGERDWWPKSSEHSCKWTSPQGHGDRQLSWQDLNKLLSS